MRRTTLRRPGIDHQPQPGSMQHGHKALLHALRDPRINIAGVRRGDLIPLLDQPSPDRLSRQPRRLRDIGAIKRATGTYRYYLTRMGRAATATLCRLTESITIPEMT